MHFKFLEDSKKSSISLFIKFIFKENLISKNFQNYIFETITKLLKNVSVYRKYNFILKISVDMSSTEMPNDQKVCPICHFVHLALFVIHRNTLGSLFHFTAHRPVSTRYGSVQRAVAQRILRENLFHCRKSMSVLFDSIVCHHFVLSLHLD